MWVGWRQDPVTGQFGSSEIAAVRELARVWEDLMPSEQRLRMDGLGLTLKGKRDLRLRLVDAQPESVAPRLAEVRQLRAV
jgi:hypothetical protein